MSDPTLVTDPASEPDTDEPRVGVEDAHEYGIVLHAADTLDDDDPVFLAGLVT